MKKIIFTFALLFLSIILFAQEKYSQKQIKDDLEYLYSTLKESHYNLFVNTSEKEYNKAFEMAIASIPDSSNLMEVYRLFQPFVALSGIGHCNMGFPFQRLYGDYFQKGGTLFPLTIQIEKDKIYVNKNYSYNDSIKQGFEILSINNKPIKDILSKIYSVIPGESEYLKSTILDLISFPRMLWNVEETVTNYHVKIRGKNGTIKNYLLKSISAGEFEEAFSQEKLIFHNERALNFIDNIAFLKPGPFMNANGSGNTSEIESFNTDEFFQFVDSSFVEIAKKNSKSLIIDLRNNSGGNNSHSDELISYFADKPFRFCSTFKVKTSQITKDFWEQVEDTSNSILKEQILTHRNGEIFDSEIPFNNPKADSLKYKGNVYVLINRYSYSQASVTAAMIQDYKFGILIGEETADPANYGSIHEFPLPNTKISIEYPKALIVRPSGDLTLKGTTPDYVVNEDVFTESDDVLDFTVELIKKKASN